MVHRLVLANLCRVCWRSYRHCHDDFSPFRCRSALNRCPGRAVANPHRLRSRSCRQLRLRASFTLNLFAPLKFGWFPLAGTAQSPRLRMVIARTTSSFKTRTPPGRAATPVLQIQARHFRPMKTSIGAFRLSRLVGNRATASGNPSTTTSFRLRTFRAFPRVNRPRFRFGLEGLPCG